MSDTYIIPTKKSPVFVAECDYFGRIERGLYKQYSIAYPDGSNQVGCVWSISYKEALVDLLEFIEENSWVIQEHPKSTFSIYLLDGRVDEKTMQVKEQRVFSISAKKAKQLLTLKAHIQ